MIGNLGSQKNLNRKNVLCFKLKIHLHYQKMWNQR